MSDADVFRLKAGVSESYLPSIQAYISRLHEQKVPPIFSPKHFCQLVGVEPAYVFAASNNPASHYRTFQIRKRSGGNRTISEPLPTLKFVQRWILDNILYALEVDKSCKAYTRGRSIKDNARIHRAQPAIVKMDVVSFFSSLRESSVYRLFYDLGYTKPVSTLLSKLCTLEGALPQGAPPSGRLANLLLKDFDATIRSYCVDNDLRYTRYADDIAISGKEISADDVMRMVSKQLSGLGLKVNSKKSLLINANNRMSVTGLVVNQKINLPREFLERIRQEVYFVEKFGIYAHCKRTSGSSPQYVLNSIIGRIVFALHIRPYDDRLRSALSKMRQHARAFQMESGPGNVVEDHLEDFPFRGPTRK